MKSIPNKAQQRILSEHMVSRAPTELRYIGGSVFRKDVNIKNFEFGVEKKFTFQFNIFFWFSPENLAR